MTFFAILMRNTQKIHWKYNMIQYKIWYAVTKVVLKFNFMNKKILMSWFWYEKNRGCIFAKIVNFWRNFRILKCVPSAITEPFEPKFCVWCLWPNLTILPCDSRVWKVFSNPYCSDLLNVMVRSVIWVTKCHLQGCDIPGNQIFLSFNGSICSTPSHFLLPETS